MDERLAKYFSRLLSPKEKAELFEDLDRNNTGKDKFAEQQNLISIIMMQEKEGDKLYAHNKFHEFKQKTHKLILRKISLQITKYAAIIVLAITVWTAYQNYIISHRQNTAYTTIEVPPGQRTHIYLPDGTSIWLNAETKLSYPSDFSAVNRKVQLQGEGYFDVTSDEKNPFVVQTSLMNVKVLGTKFNVKSYENETSLVTLMEGKVEVFTSDEMNQLTLLPNEQAFLSTDGSLTLSKRLGVEYVNAWTNGAFNYLNDNLADIAKDLERRFNVTITITEESLANEIFTYGAEENASLDQILSHLKGTKELNYTRQDNNIRIFKQ